MSSIREYFIYVNGEQAGPFNFEEIKVKKISRATLVWFEDLPEWQKAETIEELKPLFKTIPPPILAKTPNPPIPPKPETSYANNSYETPVEKSGISKTRKILLFIAAAIVLFIGVSAFASYQNEQAIQQHELEMRIAEQERLAREARIREISAELKTAYQNLENAKINLDDVSALKLLRSSSKRHEQISGAEDIVSSWQKHVNELESELRSLN